MAWMVCDYRPPGAATRNNDVAPLKLGLAWAGRDGRSSSVSGRLRPTGPFDCRRRAYAVRDNIGTGLLRLDVEPLAAARMACGCGRSWATMMEFVLRLSLVLDTGR